MWTKIHVNLTGDPNGRRFVNLSPTVLFFKLIYTIILKNMGYIKTTNTKKKFVEGITTFFYRGAMRSPSNLE